MAKLDLSKLKGNQNEGAKPASGNEQVAPASSDKPATGLAFLKNRQQPAAVPSESKATQNPAATPSKTGLAFLKQASAGGSAGSDRRADSVAPAATQQPALDAAPATGVAAKAIGDGSAGSAGGDGDIDLAGLLDNESGGSAPKLSSGFKSRFEDEIPATAPVRELPEGADKQMLMFAESLDTVYKVMHEPDLLGGIIKNIMMELGRNPEYRKLISPTDTHVMIKGMRDSMGMARIRKEETKAKRSGSSRSKKTTKIDDISTLAALDEAFSGVEL